VLIGREVRDLERDLGQQIGGARQGGLHRRHRQMAAACLGQREIEQAVERRLDQVASIPGERVGDPAAGAESRDLAVQTVAEGRAARVAVVDEQVGLDLEGTSREALDRLPATLGLRFSQVFRTLLEDDGLDEDAQRRLAGVHPVSSIFGEERLLAEQSVRRRQRKAQQDGDAAFEVRLGGRAELR